MCNIVKTFLSIMLSISLSSGAVYGFVRCLTTGYFRESMWVGVEGYYAEICLYRYKNVPSER